MVEWGREVKEEGPVKVPQPKTFSKYFDKFRKPKAFVTLLYGDTGSGKTYTAMTFPEPIYVIDTENKKPLI